MRFRSRQVLLILPCILLCFGAFWHNRSRSDQSASGPYNQDHSADRNEKSQDREKLQDLPQKEVTTKNLARSVNTNVPKREPVIVSDFCKPGFCRNGGSCKNYHNRAVCFCKSDFIGQQCEEEMDDSHRQREKIWIDIVQTNEKKLRRKRYPDVIGIGVEKCGTDALIQFMAQHPLIKTPYGHAEAQFFNAYYGKGMTYYRNHFPEAADDEILMEKTPAYFNFPPEDIPFRIKKWIPKVKLFLVVCDPVNRTYSDYIHEKIIGGISDKIIFDRLINVYMKKYKRSLVSLLDKTDSEAFKNLMDLHKKDKPSHILTTGLYYYHLRRWIDIFGRDKIYVINGEDLIQNPGNLMEKIQDFLGLPKLLLKDDFVKNDETGFYCFIPKWSHDMKLKANIYHHTRCLSKSKGRTRKAASREGSPETFAALKQFYKPFNAKLEELLNKSMNWM